MNTHFFTFFIKMHSRQQLSRSTARKCVPTEPFILHYWPITPLCHLRSFHWLPISHAALPVSAPSSCVCFHLPLPEEVADRGVLRGQRAGQERHQAPEALPQLLHVLLQGVDVWVQLSSAALHLWQHVVHQVLHLFFFLFVWTEKPSEHISCNLTAVWTLRECEGEVHSLASLTLQRSTSEFPWSASILFSIFTRRSL